MNIGVVVLSLLDGIDPSDDRMKATCTQTLMYLHVVEGIGECHSGPWTPG